MPLPTHLSDFEGSLYDTRDAEFKPLRENYSKHHAAIASVADFKATLRAGKYAWPGGYEIDFCTDDGATLCFECATDEFRNITDSIKTQASDGWRIIGAGIAEEEYGMFCDHCSRAVPTATDDD